MLLSASVLESKRDRFPGRERTGLVISSRASSLLTDLMSVPRLVILRQTYAGLVRWFSATPTTRQVLKAARLFNGYWGTDKIDWIGF